MAKRSKGRRVDKDAAKIVRQIIKEAGGKSIGKNRYDMTEAVEKEKKGGKD